MYRIATDKLLFSTRHLGVWLTLLVSGHVARNVRSTMHRLRHQLDTQSRAYSVDGLEARCRIVVSSPRTLYLQNFPAFT